MTRLEMGTINVDRDWATFPEIAGSVLNRLSERMATHRLIVDLPDDLPLVRVDATLIEQLSSWSRMSQKSAGFCGPPLARKTIASLSHRLADEASSMQRRTSPTSQLSTWVCPILTVSK